MIWLTSIRRARPRGWWILLFLPFALSGAQNAEIRVSVRPSPFYIERTATAQLVNCDLIVENTTNMKWTLRELEVSVYDAQDRLALRKFVNDNGNSPSIATLNQRELPPHGRILIFNPLPSFPLDAPLSILRFRLLWVADDDATQETWCTARPSRYAAQTPLRLPLRGRVLVWDGHDYYAHHRRFNYLTPRAQATGTNSNPDRYAYDFVPVDEAGAMHKAGPDLTLRNENWFGFGQPIYAAGDGRVVAVSDDAPDNGEVDSARFEKNRLADYGNYILIEHGKGEIALYGHLRQGSAKVKLGEAVQQGRQIAAIGGSGSSLMPHLHFQLQTTADADGEGLPSFFDRFLRFLGSRSAAVTRGQIDSGDIIEDAPPTKKN